MSGHGCGKERKENYACGGICTFTWFVGRGLRVGPNVVGVLVIIMLTQKEREAGTEAHYRSDAFDGRESTVCALPEEGICTVSGSAGDACCALALRIETSTSLQYRSLSSSLSFRFACSAFMGGRRDMAMISLSGC